MLEIRFYRAGFRVQGSQISAMGKIIAHRKFDSFDNSKIKSKLLISLAYESISKNSVEMKRASFSH